jgi:phosphoribosylanthranilate isomerase
MMADRSRIDDRHLPPRGSDPDCRTEAGSANPETGGTRTPFDAILPFVLVQIYGITTPEDAATVNALAPDNVGVVLDEGFETWDGVDEAVAKAIGSELTDVALVALSLATERDRILRTVDTLLPNVVHLARACEAISPDDLATLKQEIAPIGLMLTVPVRDEASLTHAQELSAVADYLLLDSAHPHGGQIGATGLVHDWSLSRRIVASCSVPVILAGGLGPANVREAIGAVRPFGVDSETNTSREDDRRRKDAHKVRLFIERARSALPTPDEDPSPSALKPDRPGKRAK